VLSLQYPLLYVLFSLRDTAQVSPSGFLGILMGYLLVGAAMMQR
jgi:hypothetical protein